MQTKNSNIMSEQEMNSYRLTSLEEPSDEMLKQLMIEVAEEEKIKSEQALQKTLSNAQRRNRKTNS